MKNIQKIWVLAGSIMALLTCSGCEKIESSSPEDGYNTDVAMSAVEYSIFMSKQISVIENVLMTRAVMAENIADGTYDISAEIQNVNESISKVVATQNELLVTMPAQSLDTDRQNILDLTDDAINVLIAYRDDLGSNDLQAMKTAAAEMKSCMMALSGEANAYYQ